MKKQVFNKFFQPIFYLLGILILFALIQKTGIKRFGEILCKTSLPWIFFVLCVYTGSWGLRTWRIRMLISKIKGDLRMLDAFRLHIAGFALNAILPARIGDIAMVGFLKAKKIPFGKAAAVIVQTRILDMLALLLLILPIFILLIPVNNELGMIKAAILGVLVLLVPLMLVTFDHKKIIPKVLEAIEQNLSHRILKFTITKTKETYQAYHDIAYDKQLLLSTTIISLSLWLLEGFCCYCISVAVGMPISLFAAILAVGLGNIGKSLPVTPGGVGVYEGIIALTLSWLGYPFEVAVVIGILDHLIKKLYNLAIGWPVTVSLGLNSQTIFRLFSTIGKSE